MINVKHCGQLTVSHQHNARPQAPLQGRTTAQNLKLTLMMVCCAYAAGQYIPAYAVPVHHVKHRHVAAH